MGRGLGSNGGGGGVFFYIGEIKNFEFFQTRKFPKNAKKQWKIYNILKMRKENLRFFENFFEVLVKTQGKI